MFAILPCFYLLVSATFLTFCFVVLLSLPSALVSLVLLFLACCPWPLKLLQPLFHLFNKPSRSSGLRYSRTAELIPYQLCIPGLVLAFDCYMYSGFRLLLVYSLTCASGLTLSLGIIPAVFLSLHPLFCFGFQFHCVS